MAAPSGTVSDAESGPGRLTPPGRAVEDLARLDDRELLGIVRSLPRASERRAAACDLLVTRHQRPVQELEGTRASTGVPASGPCRRGIPAIRGLVTARRK
jgi:hypothetical protein